MLLLLFFILSCGHLLLFLLLAIFLCKSLGFFFFDEVDLLGLPQRLQHRSMVNFILTVVSSDVSFDSHLVFAVAAVTVRVVCMLQSSQLFQFLKETFYIQRLTDCKRQSFNVEHLLPDFLGRIVFQKSDSMIHLWIINKRTVDFLHEVMAEGLRQRNSNVGNSIVDHVEEVELKLSLENVLLLHHGATHHNQEKLTLLESIGFAIPLPNDSSDTVLLFLIITELQHNWTESTAGSNTNSCNIVGTEFEEHRHELLINKILIKKFRVLSKI